jgi:hypothetical protein
MDSTFMGMLMHFYERVSKKGGSFLLINVGADNMRALKRLGISGIIPVRRIELKDPVQFVSMDLNAFHKTGDERIAMIKTAHEALVRANDENAKRFGPFLQLLEAEMKK